MGSSAMTKKCTAPGDSITLQNAQCQTTAFRQRVRMMIVQIFAHKTACHTKWNVPVKSIPTDVKCLVHACTLILILKLKLIALYIARRTKCCALEAEMNGDIQCQTFAFKWMQNVIHFVLKTVALTRSTVREDLMRINANYQGSA